LVDPASTSLSRTPDPSFLAAAQFEGRVAVSFASGFELVQMVAVPSEQDLDYRNPGRRA
jgi:hypothetical protein